MPLTLAQLRETMTRDQCLESILNALDALGFGTTSWQTGSVQLTLLTAVAQVYSELTEYVAALTYMHFNDTSTGAALDAFSSSHYDNTRIAGVRAVGYVAFIGGAVGPPYAITPGQLVVSESYTGTGLTYRNNGAFIIPASGYVWAEVTAELPGDEANVPNSPGPDITTLETPLAGVTVRNLDDVGMPWPPGVSTWLITPGADEESDSVLQERNSTKWAILNQVTKTGDGYVNICLASSGNITRVVVDDSLATDGTVTIYVAGPSGPVGDPIIIGECQDDVDIYRPVTADVTVVDATDFPVAVTGDVYILSAYNTADQQALIEQSLIDYINSLPIGGTWLASTPPGYVIVSELIDAIMNFDGVLDVDITVPASNQVMTIDQVASLLSGAITLNYIDV